MRKFYSLFLMVAIGFFAMANNPSPEQDLAFTWETQIRQWVHGVCPGASPILVIRQIGEEGSQEDLLAFYEGKDGRKIFAWARSREITAQAISNMYKYEVGKPMPPIPVELRIGFIPKKAFDPLFFASDEFIKVKPKSWDEMVNTGHAGSLFVSRGSISYIFQGPDEPKSEPAMTRLCRLLESFRKSVQITPGYKLFEFPQTEQMIQWRFNRALLNGDEGLAIYLLSIGASPNKDPRFFESPLEQAILRGKKALFDALVMRGANTSATTSDGLSLAGYATKHKAPWALEILKDREKR